MPGRARLVQVAPMTNVQTKTIGDRTSYTLSGKALANGDALELRLRGNRGWASVQVHGLPQLLRVRWEADDGKTLNATLSDEIELRWP